MTRGNFVPLEDVSDLVSMHQNSDHIDEYPPPLVLSIFGLHRNSLEDFLLLCQNLRVVLWAPIHITQDLQRLFIATFLVAVPG